MKYGTITFKRGITSELTGRFTDRELRVHAKAAERRGGYAVFDEHAPHVEVLDLDEFIKGYMWCAMFTEHKPTQQGAFDWSDAHAFLINVPSYIKEEMTRDCERFMARYAHLIEPGQECLTGRCFWYDREGHGTGATDRIDELGHDRAVLLANAARTFGEYDELYFYFKEKDENKDNE